MFCMAPIIIPLYSFIILPLSVTVCLVIFPQSLRCYEPMKQKWLQDKLKKKRETLQFHEMTPEVTVGIYYSNTNPFDEMPWRTFLAEILKVLRQYFPPEWKINSMACDMAKNILIKLKSNFPQFLWMPLLTWQSSHQRAKNNPGLDQSSTHTQRAAPSITAMLGLAGPPSASLQVRKIHKSCCYLV